MQASDDVLTLNFRNVHRGRASQTIMDFGTINLTFFAMEVMLASFIVAGDHPYMALSDRVSCSQFTWGRVSE